MPPEKKLRLPEEQPTLKSMGFGKYQPPSPGQTDSEPDTSFFNVSNDANQTKSIYRVIPEIIVLGVGRHII